MDSENLTSTKEHQYAVQFESLHSEGLVELGPTTSYLWRHDPKHLVFLLSRYKFVAKMLVGKRKVFEVGCGDAFGSTLVTQNGTHVHCTDFDPLFINEARAREKKNPLKSFEVVDFVAGSVQGNFDGAYSLDVIEHIEADKEDIFLRNIKSALVPTGTLIIGTPSLESQVHASVFSKAGHVNCKTGEAWRQLMAKHFGNVFLFSMNDEVLHTGFSPMAHYLFLIGTQPI